MTEATDLREKYHQSLKIWIIEALLRSQNVTHSEQAGAQRGSDSINGFLLIIVCLQISSLCTEEAAAQEQTGQVEECLKINLLKLKKEGCKKVKRAHRCLHWPLRQTDHHLDFSFSCRRKVTVSFIISFSFTNSYSYDRNQAYLFELQWCNCGYFLASMFKWIFYKEKEGSHYRINSHDPFFLEAFLTTHLCSSSPAPSSPTLTPQEVLNMLKESKADIYVDPVLHTACALDIKHHCAAIPPGKGRRESNSLRSHVTQTRKTNIPLFISTTGCYSAAVRTKEGQTLHCRSQQN